MPFAEVTREEWLAFIRQFPDRESAKTGICEPPQEICTVGGTKIAYVSFPYGEPTRYFIDRDIATSQMRGDA